MASNRSMPFHRARAGLLWGLLFFGLLQLSGAVSVERWLQSARDPEFVVKLNRLQAQRQRFPNRPLVLMLGSSRTSLGFRAGDVHANHGGAPVLVFNFGISGAGPFNQLLCLRRLLAAGIRPDLLFIEILPAMLNQPGQRPLEEIWLQGGRMSLGELSHMEAFHSEPARLIRRWCRARFLPWSSLHHSMQSVLMPDWSLPPPGPGEGFVDSFGWEAHFQKGISEWERQRLFEVARAQYRDSMGAFHLSDPPARALNELLDLCRREHIPLSLVLMPEGSQFRAMYPPDELAGIDQFLTDLSRRWQVPLLDARHWVPDRDLWDAHHPLPSGAAIFTARLKREAITPLLQNLVHTSRPPDGPMVR